VKNFTQNIGFYAHGILNLTPAESFILCRRGAITAGVSLKRETSKKADINSNKINQL
jgi:hypothetical protein